MIDLQSPMSFATVPENRVDVSPGSVETFVGGFRRFSEGQVVSDEPKAHGAEIGRPGDYLVGPVAVAVESALILVAALNSGPARAA